MAILADRSEMRFFRLGRTAIQRLRAGLRRRIDEAGSSLHLIAMTLALTPRCKNVIQVLSLPAFAIFQLDRRLLWIGRRHQESQLGLQLIRAVIAGRDSFRRRPAVLQLRVVPARKEDSNLRADGRV